MKKWKRNIIIIAVLGIILMLMFSPYIKTEYLTLRYGKEFVGLEQQTNMLDASRYLKVFSYSENKAEVFYVSDTGDMITFVKNDDAEWKLEEWKTVWSESGSADEFIWPYYR